LNFWDLYETDQDKTVNGAWHDMGGGLSLKIARADIELNSAFGVLFAKVAQTIDVNDNQAATAALAKVYAGAVILDAKGLTDRSGKKQKFSPAVIEQLLIDLPDLFKVVQRIAKDIDSFRVDKDKASDALKK
jgi:hypothetical protein